MRTSDTANDVAGATGDQPYVPRAETYPARARGIRDALPLLASVRRPQPDDGIRSEADSQFTVRRRERIFRRTLVASDASAAALSVFLAIEVGSGDLLRPGCLLVLPLIVLVAKIQGLYDRDELVIRKSTLKELPKLLNVATLAAMIIWLSRHYMASGDPHTWTLLRLWIALVVSITAFRATGRWLARRFAPLERCFFIGDLGTAAQLQAKFAHTSGSKLIGAVSPDRLDLDDIAILELARNYHIHRLIVHFTAGFAEERSIELVRAAKATGLRVTILPGVLAVVGSSVVFDDVWGMPLLGVPRFGLTRSSAALKRAFDLVGAAAGLLLCSPSLAVLAALIKLDSPGPVLFRQVRIGQDGKEFEILKFRSMVANAEELKPALRDLNEADGMFKIDDDPRITRVGRWLRKTTLDELPQLFNVLRGQMSLVGPRPLVLDEDQLITGLDRRRLMITPGMTGQWQILGSARVPLHEMIKLDYMYVANWSRWADIEILLRTIGVVIARQGM